MRLQEMLWNDLDFLKQRQKEQIQYIMNYNIRHYDPNGNVERFAEVLRSAQFILTRFTNRINELQK